MGTTSQHDIDESAIDGSKRWRWRPWLMFVISLVLLGLAGYFVYTGTDGMVGVWDSVQAAPWWMLVLIVLGPLGNHLSVSMCLHSLQSRHGKVGGVEMLVLVGSAWLLNYLPMRPGLIGRIGYHKAVNKIRFRDSVESSIWSGVLAGIANVVLVLVAMVMMRVSSDWVLMLPAVPVVVMFGLVALMPGRRSKLLMRAMAYRQIDVIVWLGRYWLAFEVLGLEMSLADIAVVSAVSQLASLMPLTGSGIGFREWAVGLTASASGHALGTAIAGDMINRVAETLVVVPVGLICSAIIARKLQKRGAAGSEGKDGLAEDDSESGSKQDDQSRDASQEDPAEG